MNKKLLAIISFSTTFLIIIILFVISIIKTNVFNSTDHKEEFAGTTLFTNIPDEKDVTINVVARSSTWGKIFDFNNEGLTENNYESHTYDFTISNNTKDEVKKFSFILTLGNEAYLSSAWNGSLEIHQNVKVKESIANIPDLREYTPSDYKLEYFYVDGEAFIKLYKGDYIVYTPSSTSNAMEMPIKAHEGTTPGMIMYVANGTNINDSTILLDYTFYRLFTTDVFFIISMSLLIAWAIILVYVISTYYQIRKYKLRHERDNEIINESIETFTGFIDAKDSYTNGHSKRVAIYTRLIAERMGFEGEELDRIYYIALLHDCGKIGVPDNILGKPGKLTDEEFETIKSHTVRGGEILSNFKSLKDAGEGARYHHEKYNGKGYPEGLKGEDIPLIARMICVADSFDAMNSNRVYRNKLSYEYITNELESNKGTHFDPKIADIMLDLIKEGKVKIE